ncbi:hypothetical protein ABZ896_12495 [Streptomyces sp. NPDC047072]|uniref:hypothetical protein n=1 Tax=Streptomyces sp. NPDC047072 TaxID=3154809 RepID=UPI0033DE32F9
MNALAARLSTTRARAIEEMADAVPKWGVDTPDDPGVAELAEVLAAAVGRLLGGLDAHDAATAHLTAAVEHLRAAARLGGLMPVVFCAHLRLALQQERRARPALDRAGTPSR